MRRILLALAAGVAVGAALAAPQIPSFRTLTLPGTPSLTFATLLLGLSPFPDGPWSAVWAAALPGLAVATLQTFLAAWLGAGILWRLLPGISAAACWGLGILPGSLMVVLAVRVAADAAGLLGPETFSWTIVASAFLIAGSAWRLRAPLPEPLGAMISLTLLALLLVFGVQSGALHVTGDSSNLVHAALVHSVPPRIPLHHGDILWAAPAQILAGGSPDTKPHWLSALWIWHAAGRLSLLWAAWLAIGTLLPARRPRWERAALTAFLCLGAHTILPWHSPLVFNSGSPPLFALHPDTWGTIALAWGAAAHTRWPRRAAIAGAAMPLVSIGVLLGAAIAAAGSVLQRAPMAAAAWTLFVATLLPGLIPLLPSAAGLAITIAVAFLAIGLLLRPAPTIPLAISTTALLVAAFVVGTFLVGGLFDPFPTPAGQAMLLETRGLLFGPDGRTIPLFGTDAPGVGAPNPYCSHFAGAFCADAPQAFLRLGLPGVLLAVALWLRPLGRRATGIGATMALAAATLTAGLLLVHWGYPDIERTGFHPMASWLRTRLLEPGWFMTLLLTVTLLARRIPPPVSAVLALVWTIGPMTQDFLPLQIWINARWLLFGP